MAVHCGVLWAVVMFPNHQIRLDHVPNRPLRAVPVMALGPFAIVAIRPLDMVCGAGAVGIIQKRNRSHEQFGAQCAEVLFVLERMGRSQHIETNGLRY